MKTTKSMIWVAVALGLLFAVAGCGQQHAEEKAPVQETYTEPVREPERRSNVQVQVDVNKGAGVQVQKGNVVIEVDKHKHKH